VRRGSARRVLSHIGRFSILYALVDFPASNPVPEGCGGMARALCVAIRRFFFEPLQAGTSFLRWMCDRVKLCAGDPLMELWLCKKILRAIFVGGDPADLTHLGGIPRVFSPFHFSVTIPIPG